MRTPAALFTLCCIVCVGGPASRGAGPASSLLERAALAWDAGDYVAALATYQQILDSSPDNATLATIALQTGELFHSVELTTDGEAPQFSPDGRSIAYETGLALDQITRIVTQQDDAVRAVAELPGTGAAFSPDSSKVAYLKIVPSAPLRESLAAVIAAPAAQRTQRAAAFNALLARESRLTIRDMRTRVETEIPAGDVEKAVVAFGAEGTLAVSGRTGTAAAQVYVIAPDGQMTAATSGAGDKALTQVSADGRIALFSVRPVDAERRGTRPRPPTHFGIVRLADGQATTFAATAASLSADGRRVAYISRRYDTNELVVASSGAPGAGTVIRAGPDRLDAPTFSPDGARVAFQMMTKENWELYVVPADGKEAVRVTREIQHDALPRFLTNDRLLGTIGEPRHRRAQVYDLPSMARTPVFHNNTVRTISPEYAWIPSPDGRRLLVVAERDGDTVSPERGIYLTDLMRRVTRDELRARVRAQHDAEQALRANAQRIYAPIATRVREVVGEASAARVYGYEKALFDFDSKHVSRPGNKLASAYLFDTYKSFGYEPAYQWFEARGALGGQSANVIATLIGTENPELVYVISSHYDSVAAGPGADDNSSGSAALLETARLLAKHPLPATVVFASFTGEESGLLGSREFVRRAVSGRMNLVGALNNDMVGWANDHRLDSTIRYSNPGIRDVQHAAAMQFTKLITYDALYYKSTDAAAFYEAYGDIVGGIGSYPVLGNPHYHQSHDLLDTINHQLVTEVARTTAATVMLLASSPSRLTNATAQRAPSGAVTVTWTPSPEKGVTGYLVSYGSVAPMRVSRPAVTLSNVAPGTVIGVKAVNAKGLEGWDWARVRTP